VEIESHLRDNILEDQRQEEQDNAEQEEQNRPRRERRPPDRYGEWVYIAQDEDPAHIQMHFPDKMQTNGWWQWKQK